MFGPEDVDQPLELLGLNGREPGLGRFAGDEDVNRARSSSIVLCLIPGLTHTRATGFVDFEMVEAVLFSGIL